MSINPTKEPAVYQFVKRLEAEGGGEKGYENRKIQEALRAWVNLMEMYNETDTMKLAMLLARGIPTPISESATPSVNTVQNDTKEPTMTYEEIDPNEGDYLALLANTQAKAQAQRDK